jgi:hypothetical protein
VTPVDSATFCQHPFQSIAIRCKMGLDKLISLLAVACRVCMLSPRGCQEWCLTVSATPCPYPLYRIKYLAKRGDFIQKSLVRAWVKNE